MSTINTMSNEAAERSPTVADGATNGGAEKNSGEAIDMVDISKLRLQQNIDVYWPSEQRHYPGIITGISMEHKTVNVDYDDDTKGKDIPINLLFNPKFWKNTFRYLPRSLIQLIRSLRNNAGDFDEKQIKDIATIIKINKANPYHIAIEEFPEDTRKIIQEVFDKDKDGFVSVKELVSAAKRTKKLKDCLIQDWKWFMDFSVYFF